MDNLDLAPAEDAAIQRYEALSHSLVNYLVHEGVGSAQSHSHVAEILAPFAEAVVCEIFARAIDEAETEGEALELAQRRVAKRFTCRLAEATLTRRDITALKRALAERDRTIAELKARLAERDQPVARASDSTGDARCAAGGMRAPPKPPRPPATS